jgi:hypothetical protein
MRFLSRNPLPTSKTTGSSRSDMWLGRSVRITRYPERASGAFNALSEQLRTAGAAVVGDSKQTTYAFVYWREHWA